MTWFPSSTHENITTLSVFFFSASFIGALDYYYCQLVGEQLGFVPDECRGWVTAENPTEKLLRAYGEKAGSTVRNLIKALRDPKVGLTQFADEIEAKFSSPTTQDPNEVESIEEMV